MSARCAAFVRCTLMLGVLCGTLWICVKVVLGFHNTVTVEGRVKAISCSQSRRGEAFASVSMELKGGEQWSGSIVRRPGCEYWRRVWQSGRHARVKAASGGNIYSISIGRNFYKLGSPSIATFGFAFVFSPGLAFLVYLTRRIYRNDRMLALEFISDVRSRLKGRA